MTIRACMLKCLSFCANRLPNQFKCVRFNFVDMKKNSINTPNFDALHAAFTDAIILGVSYRRSSTDLCECHKFISFLRIDIVPLIYLRTFTFEVSLVVMWWWANERDLSMPFYTKIHNIIVLVQNHTSQTLSSSMQTQYNWMSKTSKLIYTIFIISVANWWTKTIIYQTDTNTYTYTYTHNILYIHIIPHHLCMLVVSLSGI